MRLSRSLPGAALLLAAALAAPTGAGSPAAAAPAAVGTTAAASAGATATSAPPEALCPPGASPAEGRGLDGGIGCVPDAEVETETPDAKLTSLSASQLARKGGNGEDRLRAYYQAQALAENAEASREGAGEFVTAAGPVASSTTPWTNVGPNPLKFDVPGYPGGNSGLGMGAGRVSSIAVDPTDPTGATVYVGAAAGGVWKSTDTGTTWTPVFDDQPTLSIGDIAVAPSGWVYVGTGEESSGTDNYAGVGVFRSKDGGRTWERNAQVPADTVISRVTVSGDNVFVATSKGLWRSSNRGDSYTDVLLPTNAAKTGPSALFLGNFVSDVKVRPGVPDEVFAAVGWRSGGIEGAGLYKSTNAGATWVRSIDNSNRVSTGYGAAGQSNDPLGRTYLAFADGPNQDNKVLWALIEDPGLLNNDSTPLELGPGVEPAARVPFTVLNGLYRSGDAGTTWTLKGNYENLVTADGSSYTPTFTAGMSGPGVQAWYNQYVAVDPTNADRVLVGLEEIFQTTAGANTPAGPATFSVVGRYGNSCTPVNVQCPVFSGTTTHPDQHAVDFTVLPNGSTRAYVGNDGGAYVQDRAPAELRYTSEAWKSLAVGMPTHQFHAATMGSDGVIYGGMQDNGTARVQPDGQAIEILGGDGFDTMVDPTNSDNLYDEVQVGAMRKSINGGKSHTIITPTGARRMQFFTPFEMDPTNKDHLVYGAGDIHESTLGINTTSGSWKVVFELGKPNTEEEPAQASNAANAIDVQGTSVYAAFCGECNATPLAGKGGRYDPAIFNGGIATNVTPGCTPVSGAAPGQPGNCWRVAAGNGLPERFIAGLEIDPADPKTVYVAMSSYRRRWLYDVPARTEPGGILFKSVDGGENFTDISGDLPETFASDVIVQGERLVVGTDAGVFANASKDSSEFVPFGAGLPAGVPAYDLSLNPQGTTVLLATHGRGLYTLDLTAVDPGEPVIPEAPVALLLPVAALAVGGIVFGSRRRRHSGAL